MLVSCTHACTSTSKTHLVCVFVALHQMWLGAILPQCWMLWGELWTRPKSWPSRTQTMTHSTSRRCSGWLHWEAAKVRHKPSCHSETKPALYRGYNKNMKCSVPLLFIFSISSRFSRLSAFAHSKSLCIRALQQKSLIQNTSSCGNKIVLMMTDCDFTQGHRIQQFLWLCVLPVALSLDDQIGNFEVGKDFDALRVNVAAPGAPIDVFQCEEPKVGCWELS